MICKEIALFLLDPVDDDWTWEDYAFLYFKIVPTIDNVDPVPNSSCLRRATDNGVGQVNQYVSAAGTIKAGE